jgi:branched-chain amino acid aminotransferase
MVRGTTIITPPIEDGCLRGILRKQLIEICSESKEYNLEETSISPFDLQKADELLITNVINGIQPVKKFRKKEFSSLVAKNLLQKLNEKVKL